jgi:ubiquinone/menaquinone biosynthesis C-methylase UbiE
MSSQVAREYFEFIADLGMTKHYGAMEATRQLIDLCRIAAADYVLDVGCGVGATPCYLAKTANCRVMGVDLLEKMVQASRARAKAEGVEDRVQFKVADARELPFDDDLFDAVIMESVNVFFDDKLPAMREYVRVTKPGGYVGITEMTWLQPPSAGMEKAFKETAHAQALDAAGLKTLMETAGLTDVVGSAHRIDMGKESQGRFERYGRGGIARSMLRMLRMFLTEPRARRIIGGGLGAVSRDLLDVMGYGVFAGRKGLGGLDDEY